MRKLKVIAAWLLALAFVSPTAFLVACDKEETLHSPPVSTESESAEEALPETPPATETPPIADELPITPEEETPPSPPQAEYIRCTGDIIVYGCQDVRWRV